MHQNLNDYSVLTFDCYGTLIDWESGIWDAFQPLLFSNSCDEYDRQTVLQCHAKAESAQQNKTPDMLYPEILHHVHIAVAKALGLKTSPDLDHKFGQSVPYWPAFPDTADALRILKKHYKLVILSNVDNAGFSASNTKLGVEFDRIFTAEEIGSYKPDPANFEYMLSRLEQDLSIESHRILHVAQSLFHDHVPARKAGLNCGWIDRQDLNRSENWGATVVVDERPEVDFLFRSMMEMADVCNRCTDSDSMPQ